MTISRRTAVGRKSHRYLKIFELIGVYFIFAWPTISGCSQENKQVSNQTTENQDSQTEIRSAKGTSIFLSWDHSHDSNTITSYKLYFNEETDLDPQRNYFKSISRDDFDSMMDHPSLDIELESEPSLRALLGKRACFTVTAVNKQAVESDPSNQVCVAL